MEYKNLLSSIDYLSSKIGNKRIDEVNFDNAATTPPFKNVLTEIIKLSEEYGSIGRGMGRKSEITTRLYKESRDYLLNYFNVKEKDKYTVLYVGNTTDGINKLARILIKNRDDIVLSTRMEHHSNDLPWRRRCRVEYAEVDSNGRLIIDDIEKKLKNNKGKIKYVTVTGASNVTGYKNDLNVISEVAHKYNSKLIVDGAQLIPHIKLDINNIDFLVFSGHKLYAPFGSGVIIGLKEEFDNRLADNEGGGTVNIVLDREINYLNTPEKNQAGTPNYFGIISIITALKEMDKIGFDKIEKKEKRLKKKIMSGLKGIPQIKIYGDNNYYEDTLGITVFNLKKMNHEKVSKLLANQYKIAVRQGWFCAHPYCRRLMGLSEKEANSFWQNKSTLTKGMVRVSFGVYNTEKEVDYFLEAVDNIQKQNK